MGKKAHSHRDTLISFFHAIAKDTLRLFSFLTILLFAFFLPGMNYLSLLNLRYELPPVRATEFDNFVPSKYPIKTTTEPLPNLTSQAVAIRDIESGAPLLEVNPTVRLRPASLTKLMTALVALDAYNLTDVLLVNRLGEIASQSEMGLSVGDQIAVEDLLYGLLIPSGNDAAYTLADNYPGGIEAFVAQMNKKARTFHLTNTHFENPAGLDSFDHYSTSHDISLLSVEALKNPVISRIVRLSTARVTDITGEKVYELKNVNKLLDSVSGVDGIKTGFTEEAGQCLAISVSRNGHRVIIVIMGSQDRFSESTELANWVYRSYEWQNLTPSTF